MRSRLCLAVVFVLALGLTACTGGGCQTNADCASLGANFVCANETCVQDTPQDAGQDSGTPDGGAPDSGLPDSGTPDSGTPDSGTPDSGTSDAGLGCTADWQCSPATPACDTSLHVCVVCTTSNRAKCSANEVCSNDTCVATDAGSGSPEASLRLTEINANISDAGGGDRLELVARSSGTVDTQQIRELVGNTALATFPAGMTVAKGDVIVVHLDVNAPCTEQLQPSDCPSAIYGPTYDDSAWDIVGLAPLAYSSKVIAVLRGDGGTADAVPFTKPSTTAPGAFPTTVASLESSGLWASMDGGICVDTTTCEGDAVDWTGLTTDDSTSVQHVSTFGPTPDDKTAWAMDASTWGSFTETGTDAGTGSSDGGTFKVGEWNLEFFGSDAGGPSDEALQASNVATVMGQTDADIWALEEVCDETRLSDVLNTLSGTYGETYEAVLPDTSSVSNPYSGYGGSWGQKTALLFRSGTFTKVSADLVYNPTDTQTGTAIDSSWGSNFSSRDPLEVHLQYSTASGTKDLWVIVLHLKAGSSSYSQRAQQSSDLKKYLDEYHPNDAVMMVGDWNDDLNASIDGTDPSPFVNFLNATSSYEFPSKYFTDNGMATTVSYSSAIDHHLVTNELFGNLVAGSQTVLHPSITNYGTTTSDHYPTEVSYHW